MNRYCVSIIVIITVICIQSADSIPLQAQNQINIIINSDNYEIDKYNYLNEVNYILKRINEQKTKNEHHEVNIIKSPRIHFQFEKSEYNLSISPSTVGIIACFSVNTSESGNIVYNLDSDDVYINKVFRLGSNSGLLYADSPIRLGVYNFNVTADIIQKHLHATAKVEVTVKGKKKTHVDLKITNFKFKLAVIRTDESNTILADRQENFNGKIIREDVGNVNNNDIFEPSDQQFARKILNKDFVSGLQYSDIKELLGKSGTQSDKEKDSLFLQLIPINSRHKRAILPSDTSTRPNLIDAYSTSSVHSHRIYQESVFADIMMSGFVLFIVSFGSLFFVGSILYFAYKRLKKCGDYAIDEDAKSVTKQSDDETVYSTVHSEMKNPNLLNLPDVKQNRVVDSIEITKQKLQNGQPTVFTIQKSYEEEAAKIRKGDECFIDHNTRGDQAAHVIDMSQLSFGGVSEYSTVLLQSSSILTPSITATFVDEQENLPPSILSTSRRNSISSKKEASIGSIDGEEGQSRRKSVSFSEIVELYQ